MSETLVVLFIELASTKSYYFINYSEMGAFSGGELLVIDAPTLTVYEKFYRWSSSFGYCRWVKVLEKK